MKRCTRCGDTKDSSEFHKASDHKDGLESTCKRCASDVAREYYLKNKGRILERNKRWYSDHPEHVSAKSKRYRAKHPEKVRAAEKKRYKDHPEGKIKSAQKWYFSHPETVRSARRKRDARRRATPNGKLNMRMSSAINDSLGRNFGSKRNRHWEILVGYTADQLIKHIEKQFNPGMSWDNRGTCWEIDHKIPISAFNFERPEDIDFRRCWALTNLQPLETMKNMKKRDRIEKPFQPSLLIVEARV